MTIKINIIEDNKDQDEMIIECPYCHKHIKYGDTIIISGFIGCLNCYWGYG